MRLFEKQVEGSRGFLRFRKNKGTSVISDSIDSLYQRFGEGVFNGEKVGQVQMLQLKSASKNISLKETQPGN
jgi:hypothetical protein